MTDTDTAEIVVRRWKEFFEGPGAALALRHWRVLLAADAAYHRKHGREEVAKAVEALAREVAN